MFINSMLPVREYGRMNAQDFKGLPVHGQYGGPGYTGGRITQVGDYNVTPDTLIDSFYRDHDYGYEFGDKSDADALLAERLFSAGHYVQAAFWKLKGINGQARHALQALSLGLVGIEPNPGPKKKKVVARRPRNGNGGPRFGPPSSSQSFVPMSRSVTTRFSQIQSHVEKGSVLLGQANPGSASPNAIAFLQDLAPENVSVRLEKFAGLYQQYKFGGGRIIFNTSLAGTATGQAIMTYDTDPTLYPDTAVSDCMTESGKVGAVSFSIREPAVMVIPASDKTFYCNYDIAEPRTSSPGYAMVTAVTGCPSTTWGTLTFEFSYTFMRNAGDRNDQRYLWLTATGSDCVSAADAKESVFPLDVDGQRTQYGDSAWQAWVDPADKKWIRVGPYTNLMVRFRLKGTGFSGTLLSTSNMTLGIYEEAGTLGTDVWAVAHVYTLSRPGRLRVHLTAVTTLTACDLFISRIDWSVAPTDVVALSKKNVHVSPEEFGMEDGKSAEFVERPRFDDEKVAVAKAPVRRS